MRKPQNFEDVLDGLKRTLEGLQAISEIASKDSLEVLYGLAYPGHLIGAIEFIENNCPNE